MNNNQTDDFLWTCKEMYLNGITPGSDAANKSEGFIRLRNISLQYFEDSKYDAFAGLLQESQYYIQLWAAHFLIEDGHPSEEIREKALEEVVKYSHHPLNPKVAEEEKEWLSRNANRR